MQYGGQHDGIDRQEFELMLQNLDGFSELDSCMSSQKVAPVACALRPPCPLPSANAAACGQLNGSTVAPERAVLTLCVLWYRGKSALGTTWTKSLSALT